MRIVLCGGGTAGHVHPALAIAEEFMRRGNNEILYIGRKNGDESRPIYEADIDVCELEVHGLERKITYKNIKSILSAIKARKAAREIILRFHPDAVIGTGGYVCWPVLSAAAALKIPCIIHESNAKAGLSTRLIYKKCDKVLVNYDETKNELRDAKEIISVGNPLRADFLSVTRRDARRRLGLRDNEIFIASFGGSLGADRINDAAISLMKKFSEKKPQIRHLHATGKRLYSENEYKEYAKGKNGCVILPYIDNMPTVMHAADIVICRSGAVTLSELAATATPAILIPSPNVTANHQYKNAKLLSDSGAAILIEESELNGERLAFEVANLCKDKDKRLKLSKCIEKFANKGAAGLIADIITEVAR